VSPLVSTFAGASVRALGWTASGTGKYYIGLLSAGSTSSTLMTVYPQQDGSCGYVIGSVAFGYINSYGNLVMQKDSALSNIGGNAVLDSTGNFYFQNGTAVASYTSAGALNWAETHSNSGRSVYLKDFGGGAIYGGDQTLNGFGISKMTTGGAITWQHQLATAGAPSAFTLDASQNSYVYGNFGSSNPNTSVLAKYNSAGAIQWQVSSSMNALSGGLVNATTDSAGNTYIAEGGGNTQTMYLTKINASGAQQWQLSLTLGLGLTAPQMATDSAGNVYLSGSRSTSVGTYLFKFDGTGSLLWQRNIVTTSPAPTSQIHIADMHISGTSMYLIANSGESTTRTFIMRLPTDGTLTGSYVVGSVTIAYSVASALTTSVVTDHTYATSTYVDSTTAYTVSASTDTATTTAFTWSTQVLN
jgi:hypothetical protein